MPCECSVCLSVLTLPTRKEKTEITTATPGSCAETLLGQDQRICSSLEEKLQLYAELTELTLHSPEPVLHRHLLVQPDADSETPPQASMLLTAAVREGEQQCLFIKNLID